MKSGYQVVDSNSWSLTLGEDYDWHRSRMVFEALENSKLRFSYCVADDSSNYCWELSLLRKATTSLSHVSLVEELDFMAEQGTQRTDFGKPTSATRLDMVHRMTIKDYFQKVREEEEEEEEEEEADISDEFDSEVEYSSEECEESD
ncbi:hypothetical protein MPER_07822 [Moniliophthora perniciosa FA553]|nr:hypothetical protein MPER_07822 [Moniliophthora perniciosa FA553]